MALRRAFFRWLLPAAFILPLWLFIGWGVFHAGGWAFLWVLFVAIPSVFLGQLLLTVLVRSRGTVRHSGMVSWWDVIGFTVWHGLSIAVGCYPKSGFWWLLTLAVIVFIGMVWLMLWQLFREAQPSLFLRRTSDGIPYIPADASAGQSHEPADVFIVNEKHTPPTA